MVKIPKGLKGLGRGKGEESARKQESRAVKNAEARVSSVIDESAPEAARELLQKNTHFTLPNRVGWMVLVLPVTNIGGLSKRESRSEDKGSLVQRIIKDDINVVATRQMLDNESFAFIPNAGTLENMGEFSLLHDEADENGEIAPKYVWGMIAATPDDDAELPVRVVRFGTLDEAVRIERGDLDLAEAFPKLTRWARDYQDEASTPMPPLAELENDGLPGHEEDSTEDLAPTTSQEGNEPEDEPESDDSGLAETQVSAPVQDSEEEDPFGDTAEAAGGSAPEIVVDEEGAVDYNETDAEDEGDDDLAEGFDEPVQVPTLDDETEDSDDTFLDEGSDGELSEAQWVAQRGGPDIEVEQVRQTIARRFFSDDLDLDVDLSEFDVNFGLREVPQLQVSEGLSDWLGAHAAQFVADANAALRARYEQHQQELRRVYVDEVSRRIEAGMPELSLEDPSSKYASLIQAAEDDLEEARRESEKRISDRRKQLREEFEANAEERAKLAADTARVQYKERNQGRYDRMAAEAGREVEQESENVYDHHKAEALALRATAAQHIRDVAMTKTMAELNERSAEFAEIEFSLLEQFNTELNEMIAKHAQDDVVRVNVLRDELERDQSLERLREEHHKELERVNERAQQRLDGLTRDYKAQQEAALVEMRAANERHAQELGVAQRDAESARKYADTVNEMIEKVRAESRTEAADSIQSKDRLIEDLKDRLDAAERSAKMTDWISHKLGWGLAVLILLASVVFIAVGWLVHDWAPAGSVDAATWFTMVGIDPQMLN